MNFQSKHLSQLNLKVSRKKLKHFQPGLLSMCRTGNKLRSPAWKWLHHLTFNTQNDSGHRLPYHIFKATVQWMTHFKSNGTAIVPWQLRKMSWYDRKPQNIWADRTVYIIYIIIKYFTVQIKLLYTMQCFRFNYMWTPPRPTNNMLLTHQSISY